MKQYGWPIGLVLTAVVMGSGGFFIGTLTERVSNLERMSSIVPQASLSSLEARAPLVAAAAPIYPQATPQPFQATPSIAPVAPTVATNGLTADGVPVQAQPVLDNPELAARLIEAVSKTTSITTAGQDGQTGTPIYAFIDPRCPYCAKAAEELVGNVPVTWISTTVLGDTENGLRMVEALQSAEDPTAALELMHNRQLVPVAPSAETREAVNENAGVLYSLYAGAESSIAVPTLLVPEADGSLKLFRGFGDGDGAKIIAAYGG